MTEENERLRRDNERFVRLIDSGEWGRGRVSELVRVISLPVDLIHSVIVLLATNWST